MASEDSVSTIRAQEAIDLGTQYSFDYSEYYGDYFNGFYGQAMLTPPYFIDSQKRGESLPYYLTERQLKIIRDRQRRLCGENEFAYAGIENRISYIVGSGFTFRVLPTRETVEESLVRQTQRVLDVFVEANRLSEREAETVKRDDRDGESFTRLFFQDSGLLVLRWVEPEHVRSPAGDSDPGRSFGIECDPKDIESIRGYWVVEEPLRGNQPVFVKAKEIVHSKRNVDSASKRGLPLFYPVEANLRRAEELLAAMTVTAKTRAKIALIRRMDGITKGAAQTMKSEIETGQVYDPVSGGATNVEQYKLGTILTSGKNIEYEFPEIRSQESGIEVLKAELRAVAARLVMPESMFTADASGGTYSSQLVAEAPATRNFERLQRYYRSMFAESRAPGHESLAWRQIAHAVRCGILPREVLTHIKIVAEAPAIIQRDPDKAAAANKTYFDMGVKSPQQICGELGGNWDQVTRERKEAGLPDPAQLNAAMNAGAGGAMPGADPMNPEASGEQPGDQVSDDPDASGGEFEFDASTFEDL